MKAIRIVLGLLLTAFLAACGGGGGSPGGNPNQPDLVTTAGASVVIAPGGVGVYGISGGVPPYRVRNADAAIALGAVNGNGLTINAIKPGQSIVSVLDNAGDSVDIAVRVGSSTALAVTAPANVSLALGPAASQTFEIRGGVAPYVAVSSDARVVGVYLDANAAKITVTGIAVGSSTVTVRDQANNVVSFIASTAASQPLSTSAPATMTLAVSGVQTYKIAGGVKPYQVSSNNPAVLSASKQFEDDLVLRGISGGDAVVVITDFGGAVLTRTVAVGSSNELFTTAPESLTLAPSEQTGNFTISGGAAPYAVTTSSGAIAQVTFSGSTFSITAGTVGGAATVAITDSKGTRIAVSVTVNAPAGGETPVQPAALIEVLTSANTMQSAGTGVTITAYVKDSLNVAMADTPVSISADSGLLQNASTRTDTNGVATAQLLVGADKSNRTIRVTVRSGTASSFVTVSVVGTRVVLTGDAAVQQGSSAVYAVRVLDSAGNGIPGASVLLGSSRGNTFSPTPVVTDVLGVATSTYTAVNATTTGNPDVLTASSLGATGTVNVTVSNVVFRFVSPAAGVEVPLGTTQPLTVEYRVGGVAGAGTVNFTTTRGVVASSAALVGGQVTVNLTSGTSGPGPATILAQIPGVGQASLQLLFKATTPATISAQANPGAIPPNSGSTSLSQSTIEATVRDVSNNPVSGQPVSFNIVSDLSGGNLSSPTALTDLNGKAQVQYVAGSTSTAVDGVVISASVAGVATPAQAKLTVNSQSLFITLGFGNEISNLDTTTYSKPFSVYLTDATGNPVGSQPVSISVIPRSYMTGVLTKPANQWVATVTATCRNTDFNFNGIIDGQEPSVLRPGNVVVATPSTVTTDASGRAVFNLLYGEQFAPWVTVDVVARTTVAGTESVRTTTYLLRGSAEDFSGETPPAGVTSPFGANAPAAYVAGPPVSGECAPPLP